nr:NADH dehydrogenase subunit 5 [Ptenopus garrulus]
MLTTLLYTTIIATTLTITIPALLPNNQAVILRATKIATLLSLPPSMLIINSHINSISTSMTWIPLNFNFKINFMLDQYSVLFLTIALFITSNILDFTKWYMHSDPHMAKFSKYLLLFLIAMLTLTTANNMLQLFIGWEGVGIMSFLLIGWWSSRTNANSSALQAVIYNRIGDIGLILSMAWLATHFNNWDLHHNLTHTVPTLPLIGLILAATGKSAQFGLHPWLPAAMEGPTPVSALLHSSTMVVAGVFLLVRMHPMLQNNPTALSTCLCLGALTTTHAALCAITQNDIKKIIAFSTSSQLGLMMLTIGLNQPQLTFLHITTHAFFKAMLFLCSGSMIHALNNEQDIRKMGGTHQTLPITTACLTLGCLALTGMPFLAAFYTKDTIIETISTSPTNAWALITTLFATALTAAYSLRLIFYVQLDHPRHYTLNPTESSSHQTKPILRLALGSITAGLIMTLTTLPIKPQTMTMPPTTKYAALTATVLGLIIALDLARLTNALTPPKPHHMQTTLTQLTHFNTFSHRSMPHYTLSKAQLTSLQLNDQLWYETTMPIMTQLLSQSLINKLTPLHTGMIKTYLLMLVGTLILWTLLSFLWNT